MGGKGSGAKPCAPNCTCGRHLQICLPDCNCKKHRKGSEHPNWVEFPTYQGTHARIRRKRGKANIYNCVDCGKVAKDWSWRHGTDENDIYNYDPRCASCHYHYDSC